MSDALIVVSPDRTIMRVNSATTALLGYHEAELVGRPLTMVIPIDAADEDDPLSLVLGQRLESINSLETTYCTRTGGKIPMLFSASIMRGKNGQFEGVVCAARDITDRKEAEEELKRSSREIKEMYDELRTFSYITSHDLRAPLVNIKGFINELHRGIEEIGPLLAKSLEQAEEGERQRLSQVVEKDIPEAMQFIDSSASRMDMLINAILKLSLVDRRKISREPVGLEDLVRKILKSMAGQIEPRGIWVTLGKLPDLVTDRAALEQIIGNLLDNAVKYLDPGRPGEIAITADQSNGQTILHIRDNGRGMTAEDIPRAFESFRRVGRHDVPGEGMGLAYVKTNVRTLGGRVWCESTPGQGTTFSVSLPIRAGDSVERQSIGGEGTGRRSHV
jgi:PAS domain S-box-containing protein